MKIASPIARATIPTLFHALLLLDSADCSAGVNLLSIFSSFTLFLYLPELCLEEALPEILTIVNSEPIPTPLLSKNLYAKVAFEILRGKVFAGSSQNDAKTKFLKFIQSLRL